MSIINSEDFTQPIALCSDHAGYELKQIVEKHLAELRIGFNDYGTFSTDSCDYPDFAHPCASAIESGSHQYGIAICGTGNGIAMTLNKHVGIRAALCWLPEIAKLAREHNDANILVMPGRFIDPQLALQCVDTFLNTQFEGGRHQRRIDKIPCADNC